VKWTNCLEYVFAVLHVCGGGDEKGQSKKNWGSAVEGHNMSGRQCWVAGQLVKNCELGEVLIT